MNRNYQTTESIFDFNWVTFGKFLFFISTVALILALIVIGRGCNNDTRGNLFVKKSLVDSRDTVLVKVISELPKGPYVYRLYDKTTKTVHFINAAGGGMESFTLESLLPNMSEEDRMEFFKPTRYNRYNSNYYSGAHKAYETSKPTQYWEGIPPEEGRVLKYKNQ